MRAQPLAHTGRADRARHADQPRAPDHSRTTRPLFFAARGAARPMTHVGHAPNRAPEWWRNTTWGRRLLAFSRDECERMMRKRSDDCPWNRTTAAKAGRRLDNVLALWRGFSSNVDMHCGGIEINSANVTKCRNCRCVDPRPMNAGLPAAAAYFLEKLALCRLQRCARSCNGHLHFQKLLSWNDQRLTLVSRYAGMPLVRDAVTDGKNALFHRARITRSAAYHRLPPPSSQFACMRRQLIDAGVIHMDFTCKNIFYLNGALSLGDFDMALVDDFPSKLVRVAGNPPRSNWPIAWWRLSNATDGTSSSCFKRPPLPAVNVSSHPQLAPVARSWLHNLTVRAAYRAAKARLQYAADHAADKVRPASSVLHEPPHSVG